MPLIQDITDSASPVAVASRDRSRPIKKTVYTVNVGNYEPQITELTYPLLCAYADKIGADFHVITERKFPGWPIVYEKLQIHELGRGSDWNIYFDSDALVNPEMFDVTNHLTKDTVLHNGKDMAGVRWQYDHYFMRDGRNIGSCNWFTVGSDWCLDLWKPLDMTFEEASRNIHLTVAEHNSGMFKDNHLIDDYTLSRNIARYGLKFKTLVDVCADLGWRGPDGRGISPFLYHLYNIPSKQKLQMLLGVLGTPHGQPIPHPLNPRMDPNGAPPTGMGWGLLTADQLTEYRKRWKV